MTVTPDPLAGHELTTEAGGLLSGYVALELAGLEGQLCGRILADLGAEVIKVESRRGDPVRTMSPLHNGESIRFAYLNAGKQGVALDLDEPEGRALLQDLARRSDVLLVSQTASSMDELGLPVHMLASRFPRLVTVSITGFGHTGPFADYLCPDIVGLAMGGLMGVSGSPELAPVQAPETQAYYFASMFGAQGAMLALLRRESGYGRGGTVDVTIQQALASIEQLIRIYGLEGRIVPRTGSQHKHVVPARIYPTRDGFVSLFVTDHHWKAFLDAWPDHPNEFDDPDLLRTHQRMLRLDVINTEVRRLTSRYTTAEFVGLMNDFGVPCTAVNNLAAFLADDQTRQRDVEMEVHHPGLTPALQVGFPSLINGARPPVRPAPRLGEHNRAVLSRYLELGPDEMASLEENGVLVT